MLGGHLTAPCKVNHRDLQMRKLGHREVSRPSSETQDNSRKPGLGWGFCSPEACSSYHVIWEAAPIVTVSQPSHLALKHVFSGVTTTPPPWRPHLPQYKDLSGQLLQHRTLWILLPVRLRMALLKCPTGTSILPCPKSNPLTTFAKSAPSVFLISAGGTSKPFTSLHSGVDHDFLAYPQNVHWDLLSTHFGFSLISLSTSGSPASQVT